MNKCQYICNTPAEETYCVHHHPLLEVAKMSRIIRKLELKLVQKTSKLEKMKALARSKGFEETQITRHAKGVVDGRTW